MTANKRKAHKTINAYRYPSLGAMSISREIISTLTVNGAPVAVAKTEANGIEEVTLFQPDGSGAVKRESLSMAGKSKPHQAHITRGKSGRCLVVWNACLNGEWQILFRSFNNASSCSDGPPSQVVHRSEHVIFPPVVADDGNSICVVWAEEVDGCFRVYYSCCGIGKSDWSAPMLLSRDNADCLRPCIVPVKDGWLVAWDRLADGTHAVQYTVFNGRDKPEIITLSHERERWFRPRCVVDRHGNAYMTWLAVSLVCDETLGIYDHQTAGICARIEGNNARILEDRDGRSDPRFVADLREGLLATKVHRGYHGLRRNLQPCVWNDQLWLCWEVRREADMSARKGYLVGRVYQDDAWSPTYLIHSGKAGYSLAGNLGQQDIPAFFVDIEEEDANAIQFDTISLRNPDMFRPRDPQEWGRWQPTVCVPSRDRRAPLNLHDKEYQLFWADTHCHSGQSADAEGELDELVSVGRDIAGLDAMAIINNDYYPFKALTGAEWEALQQMAAHYTRRGEFVLFPGYEYTFHRPQADCPEHDTEDFNHRYVLYPGPGGKLCRRIDSDGCTEQKLIETLHGSDALLFAHHCTWELMDDQLDRNVEVCSSWRVCIEECDFVKRQLIEGKRFGFVGSSDSHRITPGLGGALTGIYATELTPDALWEAYRSRRVIATSGCRVAMDFRVSGFFIGEEGRVSGPPRIEATVHAPQHIECVDVIRDGKLLRRFEPDSDQTEFRFLDVDTPAGAHFYYLRVKLVGDPSFNIGNEYQRNYKPFSLENRYADNFARADGPFAWTSPIWIEKLD